MVNPNVIRRRLARLDEYLEVLRGLAAHPVDEFVASPERYGSAERFLQLAIEAIGDVGGHLVAELELGTVERRADVPRFLRVDGQIDETLETTWTRMIGFRNILVHDYLDIDRRQVHQVLQDHLGDFEAFREVFARYL